MSISVDSYTSSSRREIDTLKADGPFTVLRIARDRYQIMVGDHAFEVAVAQGGRNAVLDFNSTYRGEQEAISIDERDGNWPQSITKLTAREGGFHLEMMDQADYCMVTPEQNLNFRIKSGPEAAYITVRETSTDVEHIPGPQEAREICRGKGPTTRSLATAATGGTGEDDPRPRWQEDREETSTMKYAPPDQVPACECRDRGTMSTMFCPRGHMTECHYPFDCRQSGCSHLERYDPVEQEVMDQYRREARELARRLADEQCAKCGGEGLFITTKKMALPEPIRIMGTDELIEDLDISEMNVCLCISAPDRQNGC